MRVRGGVIAVLLAVIGSMSTAPAVQAGPPLPPTEWGPVPDATTGTFAGTVTAEGGASVSDVHVQVWDESPSRPADVMVQVAQGSVAEDGAWSLALAPGRYSARLVDDRARLLDLDVPGTFTVAAGATTRFDVRMRLGARISGRVLNPSGRPMDDGVHAALEQRTAKGRWIPAKQPYWQTPVIWSGSAYEFSNLRAGTYRVRFTASEWFTYVTKPVKLKAGQQVVKNPRMSFGARLTGKVKVRGGGVFAGTVTVHKRVRTKAGKVKLKAVRSTVVDQDHPGFRLAKFRTGSYVVCGATFDNRRTGCLGGRTPEKAKPFKLRKNKQKNVVLRLR